MKETLREFLNHAPVFVCRPEGEILYWTQGCEELFGYSPEEAQGHIFCDLLRTEFPEDLASIEAKLRATGEWAGRLRQVTKDGRSLWVHSVWRLRDGVEPAGLMVLVQNADVTAQVRLEEQKNLLARELEHRVKNLLTVVQSLARRSFPDAPEEQLGKFEDRLIALAETNRLLREENWAEADLCALVIQITRALGADRRIRPHGPNVTIGSQDAIAFALGIHELCTNALKHGALSVPEGHVEVTWVLESDRRHLRVRWEEMGGPMPTPPQKAGFGMRLIEHAIARQIGSPVKLRFEPSGVVCEMRLAGVAAEQSGAQPGHV